MSQRKRRNEVKANVLTRSTGIPVSDMVSIETVGCRSDSQGKDGVGVNSDQTVAKGKHPTLEKEHALCTRSPQSDLEKMSSS